MLKVYTEAIMVYSMNTRCALCSSNTYPKLVVLLPLSLKLPAVLCWAEIRPRPMVLLAL
jgi:hypothetical protein